MAVSGKRLLYKFAAYTQQERARGVAAETTGFYVYNLGI